jgi:hypothetical protein
MLLGGFDRRFVNLRRRAGGGEGGLRVFTARNWFGG